MRKALIAVLVCSMSANAFADDEPPVGPQVDDVPPGEAASQPIIQHDEATPVASSQPPVAVPPDPSARTPAIAFTAISIGLVVATVGIYYHREGLADVNGITTLPGMCNDACEAEKERKRAQIDREKKMYIGTAVAAVITGGVAAYFWTKATEKSFKRPTQLTLDVHGQGAAVGLSGRF